MLDMCPKPRGTDYTKEWVFYGTKEGGDQDGLFKLYSYDVLIDRQATNAALAEWILETPSDDNVRLFSTKRIRRRTPWPHSSTPAPGFSDYSEDLKALNNTVPLLYIVREEWRDLATAWVNANTPTAEVVALGKHMMFWERHTEFNLILDQFLQTVN